MEQRKSQIKLKKKSRTLLKLLCNNTTEIYDDLLIKTLQPSMKIKLLRTLGTEIFKTLNDINPNYMKKIVYLPPPETYKKYDLLVHSRNKTKYGNHSLRVLGPHIWKSLLG